MLYCHWTLQWRSEALWTVLLTLLSFVTVLLERLYQVGSATSCQYQVRSIHQHRLVPDFHISRGKPVHILHKVFPLQVDVLVDEFVFSLGIFLLFL